MSDATTASTPADSGTATVAEPSTILTDAAATTTNEQQTQNPTETTTEATAEAKPDQAKPDDKPQGAPEEYAEFTLPEGYAMDADLAGDLKAEAKAMNLTQEQAQKLADLGAKQMQKFQAMQVDAMEKASETWVAEAKADKEFGGEKFEENLGFASKAMAEFGTPELRTLLNQSRMGNHPELIRFMIRAGKAISDDKFDAGRGKRPDTQTQADRLFSTTKT